MAELQLPLLRLTNFSLQSIKASLNFSVILINAATIPVGEVVFVIECWCLAVIGLLIHGKSACLQDSVLFGLDLKVGSVVRWAQTVIARRMLRVFNLPIG